MIWFVLSLLAFAGAVVALFLRTKLWIPIAAAVLGVGLLAPSMLYGQSVGQASVIVNLGGTIGGQNTQPGFAVKAPWQSRSEWDLFSQAVTFAGDSTGTPDYVGGTVNGQQVTSSVSGGAQANFDLSVVYSIDGNKVGELYSEFRSQERFTAQVVVPQILSVARTVPTAYSPVEFRGESRGEANEKIFASLNTALGKWGVEVSVVNLQNITYTDQVEESIREVEVSQQREAKAQADLNASKVSSQQAVVEAEAQAKANRILAESLTPELLQQRWIDAIAGSGSTIVVPDDAAPLIQVPSKTESTKPS